MADPGGLHAGCGDDYIRIFGEDTGTDRGDMMSGDAEAPSFHLLARATSSEPSDVNCVKWHPHEEGLLASAQDNGSVVIWVYQRNPP